DYLSRPSENASLPEVACGVNRVQTDLERLLHCQKVDPTLRTVRRALSEAVDDESMHLSREVKTLLSQKDRLRLNAAGVLTWKDNDGRWIAVIPKPLRHELIINNISWPQPQKWNDRKWKEERKQAVENIQREHEMDVKRSEQHHGNQMRHFSVGDLVKCRGRRSITGSGLGSKIILPKWEVLAIFSIRSADKTSSFTGFPHPTKHSSSKITVQSEIYHVISHCLEFS
ncbi:hypothetical protein EWB00_010563, partial [Schistosoma japonicum]